MKYIVMECNFSYAVVLDEDGRFLNVANRHYEVGQTVTDVIELQSSQPVIQTKTKSHYKWIGSIAAMAACLILIVTAVFQFGISPYGSVYMTINPEVRIDVNKNDIVIDIDGLNEDGKTLVEDYNYRKKDLDLVMDELVDRAIEMGYLHEGGQITLKLDADSNEWVMTKSDSLNTRLSEHLTDKLSVAIEITNKQDNPSVTIPTDPSSDISGTNYSDSDYGDSSSSGTLKPSVEDNSDSGYDSQTNYDDTDYGPGNDGITDYDDSKNDGQLNYDEDNDDSNGGDDGDSNYVTDSDSGYGN